MKRRTGRGGRMTVLAVVTDPATIARRLGALPSLGLKAASSASAISARQGSIECPRRRSNPSRVAFGGDFGLLS